MIHPLAGVLAAYGIGLADVLAMREQAVEARLDAGLAGRLPDSVLGPLEESARAELTAHGVDPATVRVTRRAHLRYDGTDTPLAVPYGPAGEMTAAFEQAYRRQFSFLMRDKPIVVEAVSVEAASTPVPVPAPAPPATPAPPGPAAGHPAEAAEHVRMFTAGQWARVPLYLRAALRAGQAVDGPAVIAEELATTVVEPGWRAAVTDRLDLLLTRVAPRPGAAQASTEADPVLLEVFSNLFMSVAEQMGVRLRSRRARWRRPRAARLLSNVDADGGLIADAPHSRCTWARRADRDGGQQNQAGSRARATSPSSTTAPAAAAALPRSSRGHSSSRRPDRVLLGTTSPSSGSPRK